MTGAQGSVPRPDGAAPLPRHHPDCFACGDLPGGLRLRFADPGPDDAGRSAVTGTFTVGEAHQGAPGLAHGGTLAATMDELFGALQHHLDEVYVTAELTTRYRAPVPLHATLQLRAWIESREGRKLWVAGEGRLGEPGGPVAVTATALFLAVPLSHFASHAAQGTDFSVVGRGSARHAGERGGDPVRSPGDDPQPRTGR
ncbi:PaaI family thioesterase [Pseudonocardia phyllosphaerae]|uniref:PaaI family thioesterase n=1 Tax=Pseudonocardia phyllosphaerae TaxID=3390502 RepID=UPI00397DBFCB